MKLAEIYRQAAEVIRVNGHNKDGYFRVPASEVGVTPGPTEYPVCAAGALSIVVFGEPTPPGPDQDGRPEFDAIVTRLNARIPEPQLYGFEGEPPVVRLAGWNDAPGRTADDVINLFEQTAREVAA
ncbi:hypothetical protein [Streptomyces sp. SID10815]|uniref:DUF6197 family protein n=1 Tax=Streptomyces sp. SID10815 TaxID=2706027 RepID=UPI0013CD9622|nr:hypothetical protein [Streptomyces sp. SID10815]NEA52350.1 hypothetical protein [Streptomyces sp. SID10815]